LPARTGAAKRYAEAVFESAKAHDGFDAWVEDLDRIVRLQRDPEVGKMLGSPAVGMPIKEKIVSAYMADTGRLARNLTMLLLTRGRLELAPQIADHYRRMLNEHRGIATAEVTSAVPLDAGEVRAVERKLSEMTGRRVVAEASVDPSILGGIVARVGDQLIDASVKGRLEALRRRLATEQ
jgi:F-type H+-transporting ATPase subunit delta